jgi:nitroreductase
MRKTATSEFPILDVLKERWSPRAYDSKPVEDEKLWSLLEAARWSPSGGNSQPWSFIVTRKGDVAFDKLVSALSGNNQKWAGNAPVLIVSIGKTTRADGTPNPYAPYDVGQAVAHMSIQAESSGLRVHQMAGFNADQLRSAFEIPDGFNPLTVIAIGYFGSLDQLPDDLQQRETLDRSRKPWNEFVFNGKFGEPLTKPEDATASK